MAETISSLRKKYAYDNKYIKDHFDRIEIVVPKGDKELFKNIAAKQGMKVGEWIKTLIYKEINKD